MVRVDQRPNLGPGEGLTLGHGDKTPHGFPPIRANGFNRGARHSDTIQEAIDWMEVRFAGGELLLDAGLWLLITTLLIRSGILLRGAGRGSGNGNQFAATLGATRLEWDGLGSDPMLDFRPKTPGSQSYLHSAGVADMVISGTDNAGGSTFSRASSCVEFRDMIDLRVLNVRTEFAREQGVFITGTNGNSSLRGLIDEHVHVWGTNISDGFGVFAHGVNCVFDAADIVGLTGLKITRLSGLRHTGAMLRMEGNCQRFDVQHVDSTFQSGGSGQAIRTVNQTLGSRHPKNIRYGYIRGGIQLSTGSFPNSAEFLDSSGNGAGVFIDSPGGGQLFYKVIDHVIGTHTETLVYPRFGVFPIALQRMSLDDGAPALSTISEIVSWEFPEPVGAGSDQTIKGSFLPPQELNDGILAGVEVFFTPGVADDNTFYRMHLVMRATTSGIDRVDSGSEASAFFTVLIPNSISTADELHVMTLLLNPTVPYNRGDLVGIELTRVDDALDTAADVLHVTEIRAIYVSDAAATNGQWDFSLPYV